MKRMKISELSGRARGIIHEMRAIHMINHAPLWRALEKELGAVPNTIVITNGEVVSWTPAS